MKTNLLFGIASSLLLTAGLTRAAERFDVLAHDSGRTSPSVIKPAAGCTSPCELIRLPETMKPVAGCTSPCELIRRTDALNPAVSHSHRGRLA